MIQGEAFPLRDAKMELLLLSQSWLNSEGMTHLSSTDFRDSSLDFHPYPYMLLRRLCLSQRLWHCPYEDEAPVSQRPYTARHSMASCVHWPSLKRLRGFHRYPHLELAFHSQNNTVFLSLIFSQNAQCLIVEKLESIKKWQETEKEITHNPTT